MNSRVLDPLQKHMSPYFIQSPNWNQWEFGSNKDYIIILLR